MNFFKHHEVIPFAPHDEEKKGKGFYYNGQEYVHHNDLHHHESAFFRTITEQKLVILILIGLFLIGLALDWHLTLIFAVAMLTILYFSDLLFNFFLIYRSFSKPTEIDITSEELHAKQDSEWPTYTIFCPLYREWDVLPQFISAMSSLDYPKEKLQVMLLLEENDHTTLEKVKNSTLPPYFQVVVVPHSNPKTKPKALNYGLKFAAGEYTVIFDAEDVPDPQQLKKAVITFERSPKHIVCVQAKLTFYNTHQNIITRVFTAEYALWFDLVLTGLQSINAPIPLGGTSNHFRTKDLHHLKGWDSFNVTEDCDLGIRLVKRGYSTAIINSFTHEEANSDLGNWINQRTRWIKGYIQTYLVHTRNMSSFMQTSQKSHILTFHLIVGGKILSMFINPIMWVITVSYFALRATVGPFIESLYPAPILYMGIFSLIIGNFLYMYYYMIGCAKREYDDIIKYVLLVPFYWLAMSIAAWKAVYEVIVVPHYWFKTKHGLHLNNKKAVKQVNATVSEHVFEKKLLHSTSFSQVMPASMREIRRDP